MGKTRLIETLAYNLYLQTLVSNPAPAVARLGDRIRSPEPGDLVLEISTIYYEDRVGTRLGRLLRTVREPAVTAEEWAEGGGGSEPIPTERVWYLELPDGREYRWVNASFIVVPTGIVRYDAPIVSDPLSVSEAARDGE